MYALGIGAGFNLGVRFKKFALSLGIDQDLMKMGTFKPNEDQKKELELTKDKYDLKTMEFHFALRWTFK